MTLKTGNIKTGFLATFLLSCTLLLFMLPAKSQTVNYKSQSLFIYVFTKNIYWPAACNKKEFLIGVYGNSPIIDELKNMASVKKAGNGQKMVIKKIENAEEITQDFLMVYLTSSKSRELSKITEKIGSNPTLLVAERDGLAKKGASINFLVMENDALKFEVNKQTLSEHNLQIDPALLQQGFSVK